MRTIQTNENSIRQFLCEHETLEKLRMQFESFGLSVSDEMPIILIFDSDKKLLFNGSLSAYESFNRDEKNQHFSDTLQVSVHYLAGETLPEWLIR